MIDVVQRKLDQLAACQCCADGFGHRVNKPTKWAAWVELPFNGTQNPTCKCKCRHDARILCRMHPDCKTWQAEEPAMQCRGAELLLAAKTTTTGCGLSEAGYYMWG